MDNELPADPLPDDLFTLFDEPVLDLDKQGGQDIPTDQRIARLELAPKTFLALPGQTAHFALRTYNASGKYLGKVQTKNVKVTLGNEKFTLEKWEQGQLKFVAPKVTALTTFTVELKDYPKLKAYGSIETVRLQDTVSNVSQEKLVFPTLVSRVEDLDEPGTFKPFTLTDYAKAMELAQGTTRYPAIFQNAGLVVGQKLVVLGYGGVLGEVTSVVQTKGKVQLVLLKPLAPKVIFKIFDPAPIQPGTAWDSLLASEPVSTAPMLSAQSRDGKVTGQALPGSFPCSGQLPTAVDFNIQPNFSFSSLDWQTQDIAIEASLQYTLNLNAAKGFKIPCEPFDLFHNAISLPGTLGLVAHAELSGELEITLAVEAQYTAVSLVGNSLHEAHILPNPSFTTKSYTFTPTLLGADVMDVNGTYGRGKTEVEIYPHLRIEIALLNARIVELLDKIADRFPYLKKGEHLGVDLNVGVDIKGTAEALTMRAAFIDGGKSALGTTVGFKAEVALGSSAGEVLDQLGLNIRPLSFEQAMPLFSANPEMPRSIKAKDLSATQSNVQLVWEPGVAPTPIQLGANPQNVLHAQRLTSPGGDLTYKKEDCKDGPLKARLIRPLAKVRRVGRG